MLFIFGWTENNNKMHGNFIWEINFIFNKSDMMMRKMNYFNIKSNFLFIHVKAWKTHWTINENCYHHRHRHHGHFHMLVMLLRLLSPGNVKLYTIHTLTLIQIKLEMVKKPNAFPFTLQQYWNTACLSSTIGLDYEKLNKCLECRMSFRI